MPPDSRGRGTACTVDEYGLLLLAELPGISLRQDQLRLS
jgi:hypothetical protein